MIEAQFPICGVAGAPGIADEAARAIRESLESYLTSAGANRARNQNKTVRLKPVTEGPGCARSCSAEEKWLSQRFRRPLRVSSARAVSINGGYYA